jgi:hypothetical protein
MRRLIVLGGLLALGCGDAPAGPSQTVRDFVQLMDRSQRVPETLKQAYELLDAGARTALAERADQASTLAGRQYAPWEMLAQGRFRLRFASAAVGGLRETIEGDSAVVVVTGKNQGERAEIPMLLEDGRWRIRLALPPLRAEPLRTGAAAPDAAPGGS